MRGPQPDPLSLSEIERNELERLVRRHNTAQQMALRGRIILEATAGKNNSQIAREFGLSVETVRAWRTRWLISRCRIDSVMSHAPAGEARSAQSKSAS
jgi:DNA-binding CsgD family transcriptional regulator